MKRFSRRFSALTRMSGRWGRSPTFAIASWMHRRRRDFDLGCFQLRGVARDRPRSWRKPRSFVMFHGVEPLYHRERREEAIVDGHPLSWRYRLLQEGLMPFMLRIACRSADDVACLNRVEAEFLAARKWGPDRGARVLAHGVTPEFFAPPRAARAVQTLLVVAQWMPMKGTRYLRDAALRCSARIRRCV